MKHLLYVPFTGLGLYSGFRGNLWFRNRIDIFKQFVIASLKSQTSQNFVVWISFTPELRGNNDISKLSNYLTENNIKHVFTYSGICFYDDKYEDSKAKERLIVALHGAIGDLNDIVGEEEEVIMTIQPSDDCYINYFVEGMQKLFKENPEINGAGFQSGYICNYQTKELAEYNPNTNPPFYTIRFKRNVFLNPLAHFQYTALKKDVGKYKVGTPIPSHEYVEYAVKYMKIMERGFLVGTHGENISTHFNHPFKGAVVDQSILKKFGLDNVSVLKIKFTWRRKFFTKLPYKVQRKLRYLAGEKKWILKPLFNILYDFIRS